MVQLIKYTCYKRLLYSHLVLIPSTWGAQEGFTREMHTIIIKQQYLSLGRAILRMSFTDPRNESDMLSAPGDFSTVDDTGNVQSLKSYGMIRMSFEDDKERKLALTKNAKIYIDADKLPNLDTNAEEPRLWWLDEKTGRWRDAGPIRPVDEADPRRGRRATGRNFLVGEIETDNFEVINIDVPWKRCFVRVETFLYGDSDQDLEPVEGVEVKMLGKDGADQFYGYTNAVSGPNGVTCLPVWCGAGGLLTAEIPDLEFADDAPVDKVKKSAIPLVPEHSNLITFPASINASVEGKNSFYFEATISGTTGPIFANNELAKCQKSGNEKSINAFRFYLIEREAKAPGHIDMRYPPGHSLAWYADKKTETSVHKCFAKFSIKTSVFQPTVMLESFTSDGKKKYGFVMEKVFKAMPSEGEKGRRIYVTCLEYRCSKPESPTMLRLTLITNTCFLYSLSSKLLNEQPRKSRDNEVQVEFTAPAAKFGKDFGLYTGEKNSAEEQCYGEHDIGVGSGKASASGYAVWVYPGWECPHVEDFESFSF